MKSLFLLRHAKSSWDDKYVDDHDRGLSKRGERAAAAMGQFFSEKGIAPERAICSTARRASLTWDILSANWPEAPEITFEEELYLAGASGLLARIRRLENELNSVLVIGHNPDIEKVIRGVASKGNKDDLARAAQKVPTCAFAEISLPFDAWSELEPGTARLEQFVIPKDLS